MDERVAIYIDGSNLYHALRDEIGRTDLNISEFAHKLTGERKLYRIYYYNVLQDPGRYPDASKEQQEFLSILRSVPYLEVRLGTMKLTQGAPVEKGVDVMLATDMLHFAWDDLYDVAILVSGDGDFVYVLQAVKNKGKHVEVAYVESHTSKDLLEIADVRHPMDKNFFQDLWWGRGRSQRRRSRGRGRGVAPSGGEKAVPAAG